MYKKAYAVPNPATPNKVITIDESKCKGCNACVKWCRNGVLVNNTEKGKPPIVLYPDECWFCGLCVKGCKFDDVITFHMPLNQHIGFKNKETGVLYRAGGKNNLPADDRPPVK